MKNLEFHGHDVILPPFSETKDWTENEDIPIEMRQEESYDRRVVPTMFKGKLQGRTDKQIFSTTLPFILPVGMCGGPVTILRDEDDSKLPSVLRTAVPDLSEPALTAAGGRKRPSSVSVELSKPANMRKEVLKARREEIASAAEEGERAGDGAVEAVADKAKAKAQVATDKPLCAELVVGLLEGIVPTDHPVEEIRGSPVFVESMDIIK